MTAHVDPMDPTVPAVTSTGDSIPSHCAIIEGRVTELRQLFNAIDPSPLYERDIDPKEEDHSWAHRHRASPAWQRGVACGGARTV
jgi:hypothetical protein